MAQVDAMAGDEMPDMFNEFHNYDSYDTYNSEFIMDPSSDAQQEDFDLLGHVPHGTPEHLLAQDSPSIAFLVPDPTQTSPISSGDSQSDSSSKQARRSNSSHTSVHGGDNMVASDLPEVKMEWLSELDTNSPYGTGGTGDGTVSPKNIQRVTGYEGFSPELMVNGISSPVNPFIGIGAQQQQNRDGQNIVASGATSVARNPYVGYPSGSFNFGQPQPLDTSTANTSRDVSPCMVMGNTCSPTTQQPPVFDFQMPHSFYPADLFSTRPTYPISASQDLTPRQMVLTIGNIPSKSRVETQIKLRLNLSHLPDGATKLHLPTHTISKPKLLEKPTPEPSPDMLELHTVVVCTSALIKDGKQTEVLRRACAAAERGRPSSTLERGNGTQQISPQDGGDVQICSGCVTRERKRAGRKKKSKVEDESFWLQDEDRRIIVFNTQEIKEWGVLAPLSLPNPDPGQRLYQKRAQQGQSYTVELPMRIACYCRHHTEKMGFQVIFTLTDWKFKVVAQGISESIMITDDHKTPPVPGSELSPGTKKSSLSKRALSATALGPVTPAEQSQPGTAFSTPPNTSQPTSPLSFEIGPSAKKRKSSGSTRITTGLTMTPCDTPQQCGPQLPCSNMASASTSPTALNLVYPPGPARHMFNMGGIGPLGGTPMPYPSGSPILGGGQQQMLSLSNTSPLPISGDLDVALYSAPGSRRQSRAPSPNASRATPESIGQDFEYGLDGAPLVHRSRHGDYSLSPRELGQSQARVVETTRSQAVVEPPHPAVSAGFVGQPLQTAAAQPHPTIHRVIPHQGSKSGGMEVTVLGSGFHNGLDVMFGVTQALTTTFWGTTSLVCLVPPSSHARTVNVTLKQQPLPFQQQHASKTFTYLDDEDEQLMRTALTVLGHKMSGRMDAPREIALRLIQNRGDWRGANTESNTGPAGNSRTMDSNLEPHLMNVLRLIREDKGPHTAKLNLRRSTGQAMLHLGSSLGLYRFVAELLRLQANIDLRDRGGYTPLHLAALNGHHKVVQLLVSQGADPTIRTLSGLTAADVTRSENVIRALRPAEQHTRSRSMGSMRSVNCSAVSLQSLADPMFGLPPRNPSGELGSDEESLEYSSVPESGEESLSDDDDDNQFLTMRRRSSSMRETDIDDARYGRLGSPAATMAAVRDQFAAPLQQLQHTLRQLQQLPYVPQIPNLPPLPDQAAIQRLAAMMSATMMSAISGSKSASAGDQLPAREGGNRWWDRLGSLAPPPSYNEIYPDQGRDVHETKEASAARAALEAEGDAKCAALFDNQQANSESSTTSLLLLSTTDDDAEAVGDHDLPALLQIGRKNAITKEQQENLRRAHAEKLKRLSRDRNLFFIWVYLFIYRHLSSVQSTDIVALDSSIGDRYVCHAL